MRKYLRRSTASGVVLVLLATLLTTACTKDSDDSVESVKIKGGKADTYQLGDLTVKTAEGSVPKDTELRLTKPKSLKNDNGALFGVNTVGFDLSLEGEAQPAAPLDISVPLTSDYVPPGAEPQNALLYTPMPSGNGMMELVPAVVNNGVLHARLHHLSPKIITYPNDQDFLGLAGIRPKIQSRPDCQTSVTTSAGPVKFTDASKGWDNKDGSPIQACLSVKDGQAEMAITNRVEYLMAMAATNGLQLSTASDSADERMVAFLAALIFPSKKIKAYVGHNATMNIPLPAASLPATVELQADPSSFLAQAGWSSLRFMVSILTGTSGSKSAELVENVLDTPEVVDCMRSALTVDGKPSYGEIMVVVSSKCGEQIMKALGYFIAEKGVWDVFWGRIFFLNDAEDIIRQTFWGAVNGIRMQFTGTIRVVVDGPPKAPACPSDEEALRIMRTEGIGYEEESRVVPDSKICADGWASFKVQWWMPDSFGGWSDQVYTLLRQQDNGSWAYYPSERNPVDDETCAILPAELRAKASCR